VGVEGGLVTFTPGPLHHQRKSPSPLAPIPIRQGAGWAPEPVGAQWRRDEKSLPLPGIEPWLSDPYPFTLLTRTWRFKLLAVLSLQRKLNLRKVPALLCCQLKKIKLKREIWGCRCGRDVSCSLLGCDGVWVGGCQRFRGAYRFHLQGCSRQSLKDWKQHKWGFYDLYWVLQSQITNCLGHQNALKNFIY
jgi:hypothetical protein